ncbi:hypothetical protein HO173_001626 [Letharia columbiana]|uniref:mRNA N(6)-methyladenine demethylase n=1 Tax=Letharia columbiana TaxID=112416 RepID=A0A8H6G3R3_9LECA|nr:uncharacterized protein HO173_001626 [Letharia columbiana]KAF6240018.1 hypothetical protein HO173_001626 [Letharia columbiana]
MMINSLDARDSPPQSIKSIYKKYQKLTLEAIQSDPSILDFRRGLSGEQQCRAQKVGIVPLFSIDAACSHLRLAEDHKGVAPSVDVPIYEPKAVPGLLILPALVPEHAQQDLLSKLLHRDLADPRHQTNVHLHHLLPYQATNPRKTGLSNVGNASFFTMSPVSPELFPPIDHTSHKALTVSQFLNRKLRWMTLGGQYNWTEKKYPAENAPSFPEDIAAFFHHLFPDMRPEAAILNVYAPGDTLSVHRDVSEESDNELVSISFGCDGIFIVGLETEKGEEPKCVGVRLHSGDAVVMSGPARFAWHGVPQVIGNSCPVSLRDWPAIADDESTTSVGEDPYEAWRGWMSNKRINLNMRQMKD